MSNVKNWREFLKDVPTEILSTEIDNRKEDLKSSMNLDPIVNDLIKELDYALTTFGEYSFHDKGPDEVMDINKIVRKVRGNRTIQEIATILTQFLDNYGKISSVGSEREAADLVNTIITDLDDMEDFDDLFELDDRFEY